ncbi:DsbA family protein [Limosilactobacillus panis]|uniref:DsbA family protein n=2 Tax=Limosilactobacillus panis TaxID=47493 RepID=A0ABT7VMM2_9LACO|nr:DsbA family protein [Limosilactobacillus panis]
MMIGGAVMLEIHLFVNPLGMRCFRCENDVLRVDQNLNAKISYQFIPMFNMQTIADTIKLYHLSSCDLRVRKEVADTLSQVILDYKAALFQGGRRGRQYLLRLQNAMVKQGWHYSDQLAHEIAEQSGLDLEMFMEDRHSAIAKEAFKKDQQMANSLGVTTTATAVVYDSAEPQYGYLMPHFDYETLIESYRNRTFNPNQSGKAFAEQYHPQGLQIVKSN